MIALTGKEQGYTLADHQDLEALSVACVETLNRRRAEKQIDGAEPSSPNNRVRSRMISQCWWRVAWGDCNGRRLFQP